MLKLNNPSEITEILIQLEKGEIDLIGLLPWSTNYTFLVTIKSGDSLLTAVYKPCAGERPLWDFERSTLCMREIAAFLVSYALQWPAIPPTVLRDGPYGPGSVQLFIDAHHEEHYFSLRKEERYKDTWKQIALFDIITNNADRKAGHCLLGRDGRIWAIDHGLTFHQESKLRTVIWDFAGQEIDKRWIANLVALAAQIEPGQPMYNALEQLLSIHELNALLDRLKSTIQSGRYPLPESDFYIPYPLI